jgi:superfamily II DNA or RNA helicase
MTNRTTPARHWLEKMRTALGGTAITADLLDQQAQQVAAVTDRLAHSAGVAQVLRDPVGTGKTAIALTTARLLLDEDLVDYLLVIAPNEAVRQQWEDRARPLFDKIEEKEYKLRRGVLLVRTPGFHTSSKSPNPERTLIIVDEAHQGLQDESTKRFRDLSGPARGARVLLVTATPYQLTTSGFATMLTIANRTPSTDTKVLTDYSAAVAKVLHRFTADDAPEALEPLVAAAARKRDEARSMLDRHLLPRTTVAVPPVPPLRPTFLPLGDWATAYAAARVLPELLGTGKTDAYQRGLTSSSETVVSNDWTVGRRLAELRSAGPHAIRSFIKQLENHLGSGTAHPKVAATTGWVVEQVAKGHHVVVFVSWLPTQRAIGTALTDALQGTPSATVSAPTGRTIPSAIRARFCRPSDGAPVVLVLSDRFSESIDLDGGLPSIVHHDLSWNPVRLTQRWGRVVRIRTGFQAVPASRIFVPVLDVEVDRRLAAVAAGRRDLASLMVPSPSATTDEAWTLPNDILERIGSDLDA